MSKKLFSDKEIKLLSKNKYVKNISQKGITYKKDDSCRIQKSSFLYVISFKVL